MADVRKLRSVDVSTFGDRVKGSQSLTSALDDGFTLTDRSEITGKPLVIVGWEISAGIGGDYVEVWAMVMFGPEDIRKCKFRDGGRAPEGIPATLRRLTESGITSNVRTIMTSQEYEFTDQTTGEVMAAARYWFEDPEDSADYEAAPPVKDRAQGGNGSRRKATATAGTDTSDEPNF